MRSAFWAPVFRAAVDVSVSMLGLCFVSHCADKSMDTCSKYVYVCVWRRLGEGRAMGRRWGTG